MGKADVVAAQEIYDVAKANAEKELVAMKQELESVREEAHAVGVLRTLEYQNAHNEMLKYVVLLRLRDAKEYRKTGRNWAQFCEEVLGESVRSVNTKIADIRPVVENFGQKFAHLAGLEWRQIRLLGRSIGQESAQIEEDVILIGEERFPLTPEYAEDIQAALEAQQQAQKRTLTEKDEELAAKDRVLSDKEKLIQDQARTLSKLEIHAKNQGITMEEDAFLAKMEALRTGFDGYMLKVDPERHLDLRENDQTTPRMLSAYLSALDYMRRQITAAHRTAVDWFGAPDISEDDGDAVGWVPPDATGDSLAPEA